MTSGQACNPIFERNLPGLCVSSDTSPNCACHSLPYGTIEIQEYTLLKMSRDRSLCSWLGKNVGVHVDAIRIHPVIWTESPSDDLPRKQTSTIAEYLPNSSRRNMIVPEQAGPMMILSGSPQGQLEQQQPYCVIIGKGTAVSSSAIPYLSRSGILRFPTCFKAVAELFTGVFSKKELIA